MKNIKPRKEGIILLSTKSIALKYCCIAILLMGCSDLAGNDKHGKLLTDYDDQLKSSFAEAKRHLDQGIYFGQNKQYRKAIMELNTAIEIYPDFPVAYRNRGLAYFMLKEYDRAILDNSKAISIDPKYTKAFEDRGNAYYAKQDYDSAILDFSKAILLDPSRIKNYFSRGKIHFDKGEYYNAIEDFTIVVVAEPSNTEGYIERAKSYSSLQRFDEAIHDLTIVIGNDPSFDIAYLNRALAYVHEDKEELAIKDFVRYLDNHPNNARVLTYLADSYVGTKKYKEAIRVSTKAIGISPELGPAYYTRAMATYLGTSNYRQAYDDINSAINLNAEYASDIAANQIVSNYRAIDDIRSNVNRISLPPMTVSLPQWGITFNKNSSIVGEIGLFNRAGKQKIQISWNKNVRVKFIPSEFEKQFNISLAIMNQGIRIVERGKSAVDESSAFWAQIEAKDQKGRPYSGIFTMWNCSSMYDVNFYLTGVRYEGLEIINEQVLKSIRCG